MRPPSDLNIAVGSTGTTSFSALSELRHWASSYAIVVSGALAFSGQLVERHVSSREG